jgi:hypothetical protein
VNAGYGPLPLLQSLCFSAGCAGAPPSP